jgi:hypothetical protein
MTLFVMLKDRTLDTDVLVNVEHVVAVADDVELNRAREVVTYSGRPHVLGATITLVNGSTLSVAETTVRIRAKITGQGVDDAAVLREMMGPQP